MTGAHGGTRGQLVGAILTATWAVTSPAAAVNTVEAPIVTGIDIDGKLGDWPGGIPWNYITREPEARFKVAYNPGEDLLYVAAEVEDETPTVGHRYGSTDALEIYTLGLEGDEPGRGELPLQIAIVPGRGEYNRDCGNPCLYSWRGTMNVAGTRTETAYTYDYHTIRYEAAVEAFTRLGDLEVMDLKPGQTIGFDVVAVDYERSGHHRWQPWGSPRTQKYSSPDAVGLLRLGPVSPPGVWEDVLSVAGTAGRVLAVLLVTGIAVAAAVAGGDAVRRKLGHPSSADERLDAVEKRLTDTQDVLIALSEKYDRLERLLQPPPGDGKES